MIKYNSLLDSLFECWNDGLDKVSRMKFCKDGIMLKADQTIDVDELWETSSRRIMFLLKDCPDGWGYDTRTMLIDEKNGEANRNLKNTFTKKLAKILYGLYENKGEINDRYVNEHIDKVKETWNSIPFAFIETKKLAGDKDVSSAEMTYALKKDKLFLAKEIDILRPTIIVCFDGENNIFNYVTQEYFMGVEPSYKNQYKYPDAKFNCCIYYYEQNNTVVINSFHPSYVEEEWVFLERVLSPFRSLLNNYKPKNL